MRIITLEELKVIITAETSELRSQLAQVKSEVNSTTRDVTKSTSKISSSFKSLFKFFSVAAVVTGLVKLSKQAIQTASDLEEVQNVVDVAFGSMAEEVNEFASTTITSLGMSELAAKKFASTYMAMGNGMQVAKQAGKEMAIELTKLTGDMASFYNVEQDIAATALKSVYTGETESLKKFGVVMTEANLQAFALSQGITKQYKDMSQAEKVALRYNYVLNSTKNAQGDFARTSNSWANQVRILKEQFNQLLGILGTGLVKAIKPVVQAMNQLLASAISVAQAMAKAFGWTEKLTGISTTVESGASSMEDLASATSDATKATNKLTEIAGFDELNTLASKNDFSDAASGISDFTMATVESTEQSEQALDNTTSRFRQFVNDIKDIFKGWYDNIPKLEINFDKEKALSDLEAIGKNLANIVAGWSSFVVTIGIEVLNDLDIGALANSFLNLQRAVSNCASAITDVLVPAFTNFYNTALKPVVQWIGTKLRDALDFVAGLFDDWADWFTESAPIINDFITAVADAFNAAWTMISPIFDWMWETLKETISKCHEQLQALFSYLLPILTELLNALTGIIQFMTGVFTGNWKLAWEGVKNTYTSIWNAMKNVVNPILTAITNMISNATAKVSDIFNNMKTKVSNIISNLVNSVVNLFNTLKTKLSTVADTASTSVTTVFTNMKNRLVTIFTQLSTAMKTPINAIISVINKMISGVVTGINNMIKALNKLKFSIPSWVPGLGGKSFSLNISTISAPQIPLLAKGGIIDSPTFAMLGEYPGATNNPEIATPQSLLEKIIANKNGELISAWSQMTRQLIAAIEDIDMEVSIGDDVIAQSAQRGNNSYRRMTGKPLIA